MTHGKIRGRSVTVPALARVEGEGGLEVVVHDGQVTDARLDIYEPPRFFEALLRGRRHTEPPDITARICGICPIAYQMSGCQAIEDACGVVVPEPIAALLQVPHSTALHSLLDGSGTYLVGPMARYSLNYDRLAGPAADAARDAGLGPTCTNPFRSIIVRAVEVLYACDEALRLIGDYEPPDPPSTDVPPREATGFGCTEAPRGLLYNRYQITADGIITDAKIVPPTSQNQRIIEADLRAFVTDRLELPHDRLTWECEQAVRSYDPCISCAAHFLDLRVQRT